MWYSRKKIFHEDRCITSSGELWMKVRAVGFDILMLLVFDCCFQKFYKLTFTVYMHIYRRVASPLSKFFQVLPQVATLVNNCTRHG